MSSTLKVRGAIIFQAHRYLGGFSSSQSIFSPHTLQVLLMVVRVALQLACLHPVLVVS